MLVSVRTTVAGVSVGPSGWGDRRCVLTAAVLEAMFEAERPAEESRDSVHGQAALLHPRIIQASAPPHSAASLAASGRPDSGLARTWTL